MNQTLAKRVAIASFAALMLSVVCSCGAHRGGPSAVDPDVASEFTVTESGLKYKILRKGYGRKPQPADRVEVDYSGWLDDGTVFDTSYERQESAIVTLPVMLEGWAEGVQLISEGGMIELEIPPDLAYGEKGLVPKIPPNSTLHFKVELHHIQ